MKKAVITIPENIQNTDCQTNGVHPIVLINALQLLQKHFAREIVKMAIKEVGNDQRIQAQWMDRLTKKYLGGSKGDLNMDDINRFN